jgi:hypothetical protein
VEISAKRNEANKINLKFSRERGPPQESPWILISQTFLRISMELNY